MVKHRGQLQKTEPEGSLEQALPQGFMCRYRSCNSRQDHVVIQRHQRVQRTCVPSDLQPKLLRHCARGLLRKEPFAFLLSRLKARYSLLAAFAKLSGANAAVCPKSASLELAASSLSRKTLWCVPQKTVQKHEIAQRS
eukprot:591313-Amphidinium_carterae.1